MSFSRMPGQQQNNPYNGVQSSEVTPFQILKVKVYPVINNVILKLIDHIVKSQQVEKHEQRLKKKKLLDELERKYIEREIEKEELGSDYEQSDDDAYYKKLQMKEQDVQSIIFKRLQKSKSKKYSKESNQATGEFTELGENVFNPIQFIIAQLKRYQQLKKQGRLSEFQNNKLSSNVQQPIKMRKNQDFN